MKYGMLTFFGNYFGKKREQKSLRRLCSLRASAAELTSRQLTENVNSENPKVQQERDSYHLQYGGVTANDEWQTAETLDPMSNSYRKLLVKIPGTALKITHMQVEGKRW